MSEHSAWHLKGDMLSDFLSRMKGQKPPEYLIQDLLIPQRYLLLSGRTGLGKSLLATQQMFSFTTGKPWIGFQVKRCISLYMNFELPDFELEKRLKLQGNGYLWDDFEPRVYSAPNNPPENLKELESLIVDGPMPEVVIIDSFRQVYRGKINDNDEVAKWVQQLHGIAIRRNLAFVILQNTGKAKPFMERGAAEEAIGAFELANRAVSVMVAVAQQKRGEHGHFGSKASDEIELHIPKYGASTRQLDTKYLKLNRETLVFEEQDSRWY